MSNLKRIKRLLEIAAIRNIETLQLTAYDYSLENYYESSIVVVIDLKKRNVYQRESFPNFMNKEDEYTRIQNLSNKLLSGLFREVPNLFCRVSETIRHDNKDNNLTVLL